MILVIDNYDSFTYNLVQFVGELGAEPLVFRNDAITAERVRELEPKGIIISPGPGVPQNAGESIHIIQALSGETPILGVCLGHQAICVAFGGEVGRVPPLHGKSSPVDHDESRLFTGVRNPFEGGRYHSLAVNRDALPEVLRITAHTQDGTIMGLRHENHQTFGVQFHPESILTRDGKTLLRNFLQLAGEVSS
jgi:anthranilate synthase/aminodeoxychorismate synthase-like glutamine amidotransferase